MKEWAGPYEPSETLSKPTVKSNGRMSSETLAKPTVYSNGSEMTRYLSIYMVIIIPEVCTHICNSICF